MSSKLKLESNKKFDPKTLTKPKKTKTKKSLRIATLKCYIKDPKKRSSAREIARILKKGLKNDKP